MKAIAGITASVLLAIACTNNANAQNVLMNCRDSPQQNPAKVFRSGLWKQWIYWITPGPSAFLAVQRVVAEVNAARVIAGLPILLPDPAYPLIVSVFDESNPRGANGSSAIDNIPVNAEVFLATFVDDSIGGSEVLFLTDPIRSNSAVTAKLVPGVAGNFERSTESSLKSDGTKVSTEWEITTAMHDEIKFSASYPGTAIYFRSVSPPSRIAFANCNLTAYSTLIYRSSPTASYTLFDRSQGNFIDPTIKDTKIKVHIRHHDPDINAMFNDPRNAPDTLIEADRVVRIELK